ncbi:Lefftyrin [Oopsacas minuta]|uniref:Lefftyrin n=1 Tax=Oopsacas minuta TaxID=111878 RepID=A0AAV7K976_9METZ|nr:Lefftyrin [Oopsacas minuta]
MLASHIDLAGYTQIPSSTNIIATSTSSISEISCFSPQNQIYRNILHDPPPSAVLRDNDFVISIRINPSLSERRYLLLYIDQPSMEVFFSFYVNPGSFEAGITYKTCSGETNTIPIFNSGIRIFTDIFLAISVSMVNSTHLLITSLIGENNEASEEVVSGSMECSFPLDKKYIANAIPSTEGILRFLGQSMNLLLVGKSLTSEELILLKERGDLNGDITYSNSDCLCPKDYDILTEECCYNSQNNITSIRITSDDYNPESAIDDNPCTYWQSASDEENVNLSISLFPIVPEIQLIRIQFESPPSKLTLTVKSLENISIVAYVDDNCDTYSSIYICKRYLADFDDIPCCVTTSQLIDNPLLEILFSSVTPLQNISSVILSLTEFSPNSRYYSISNFNLYAISEVDIININSSTISTMGYTQTYIPTKSPISSQMFTPFVSIPKSYLTFQTSIPVHPTNSTSITRMTSKQTKVISKTSQFMTSSYIYTIPSPQTSMFTSLFTAVSSIMQSISPYSSSLHTRITDTQTTTLHQTESIIPTSTKPFYNYSTSSSLFSSLMQTSIGDSMTSSPLISSTSIPASTSTVLHTSSSTTMPTYTILSTTSTVSPSTTPTSIPTTSTSTSTILSTSTSTSTILPTSTSTSTILSTSTSTSTILPTSTSTSTILPTSTSTSTILPTSTSTSTILPTSTSTSTILPTSTSTSTILPTSTSTVLPTSMPTPPPTPILPCTKPIPTSHIDITVPDSIGYKQYHFINNSIDDSQILIIQTRMDSNNISVDIPFGLTKILQVTFSLHPVSILDYFIHSSTIWYQDNYLRVSITGLDEYNTFNVRDTNISVSLLHEDILFSQNIILSGSYNHKMIMFTLPDVWFTNSTQIISPSLLATSVYTVLINTTLSLLLPRLPPSLQVPTEHRPVVIITLPQYPLSAGDTAILPVYLLANIGARYIAIEFNYPLNSSLINLDPSYKWEFTYDLNKVVISGFVDVPLGYTAAYKLFDITILLLSRDSQVSCQLKQVFDTTYTSLVTTDLPICYFSGLYGVVESPGYLNISDDSAISISAYPQYSVLYNHAVLSQSVINIPVYTYIYTINGVSTDYSLLNCYSSDVSIAKISQDCTHLYVDGSELKGSNNLTIHFGYEDLNTEFYVKVFYPDIPITLRLTDPILNIIPVYPYRYDCTSKFQTSKLLVYTNFSSSNEITPNIDISQYIGSSLYVSHTNIAVLDDMYLEGISAGYGKVYVEISNTKIGFTNFVVSMEPVELSCYSPRIYSDNIDYNTNTLYTSLYQSMSFDLILSRTFLFNSTIGYSSVVLQFSDSNTQPVSSYNINATNSVKYTSNTYTLLDNSMITFNLPNSCPSLSSLPFITQINLSTPDDFYICISSRILTTEGDIASRFGYNTFAVLRILLVYNSQLVEATGAGFIDISIINPNIINLVMSDNGAVLYSQISSGQTEVMISLTQPALTKSVMIQVVSATGVQSSLFSPSSLKPIYTLSKLTADTFQTGYFEVELVLYNSLTILITNTSELLLEVREFSEYIDTQAPISDKAYFIDNILHVNASAVTRDTTVVLSAVYDTFTTSFVVSISTNILFISNFSEFEFIPNLTGVLASQFSVDFGIILSDGTEIVRYFDNGLIFPDLRFEVSDPTSIFFSPTTGLITLIGNSKDIVYLKVSSDNVSRISNGFAVNLSPSGNGIDLGNEDGLALPPQQINSTFKIPIWLQTSSDYKSIDISLSYEASVLSLVRILPDSSFNGGIFLSQHETLGAIRLGGILPLEIARDRILIAEIEMLAIQSRDANIHAEVITLSGPFPLYSNLLNFTHPVVTNLTQVVYSKNKLIPNIPFSTSRFRNERSVICLEKTVTSSGRNICIKCSIEVIGDINSDCKFNLNDVVYLLDYVTASYTEFSSVSGLLIKEEFDSLPLPRSDINQDGEISITDVYYLMWVNYGLFYFLESVDTSLVFPTNALPSVYNCELFVKINLVNPPLSNNQFHTYIELSHSNTVRLLNITQGDYVSNISRDDIYSDIYKASSFIIRRIIPSVFSGQIGISPILIATDGANNFQQIFIDRSPPTLNYPELRTTIPFLSSQVSLYIPEGYSPYTSYTPPQVCGGQFVYLRVLGEMQASEFTIYWPQTGGIGPFSLKRVFCSMIGRETNNIHIPCNRQITTNTDIIFPEYKVTGLNPYSLYQFQMEVNGRTSQWTQFLTPEAGEYTYTQLYYLYITNSVNNHCNVS